MGVMGIKLDPEHKQDFLLVEEGNTKSLQCLKISFILDGWYGQRAIYFFPDRHGKTSFILLSVNLPRPFCGSTVTYHLLTTSLLKVSCRWST